MSSVSLKRPFRYSSGASGEVRVRARARASRQPVLHTRPQAVVGRRVVMSGRQLQRVRPTARLRRLRKTCIIELKTLPALVYSDHTLWVVLLQQLSGGKFNVSRWDEQRLGAEHLSRNRWKQTQMRPDPEATT